MILNIIFAICMYPVLLIMYFVMKSCQKPKNKNIVLGITLPQQYLEENEVLTIRRKYVKELNWYALLSAIIPVSFFFIPYFSIILTLWMIWLLCVIFISFWIYIKYHKKMRSLKIKNQWNLDGDENWKYGMIYYNPNDSRFMVDKRIGIGSTINMAKSSAKWFIGIIVATLLIIPFISIFTIFEEFTPIGLEVSNNQVIAQHIKKEYTINLDDIKDTKMITKLPDANRIIGTSMRTLDKGLFDVDGYGHCKLCLNPENRYFIIVKTNGTTYIFSDRTDSGTKKAFSEIKK